MVHTYIYGVQMNNLNCPRGLIIKKEEKEPGGSVISAMLRHVWQACWEMSEHEFYYFWTAAVMQRKQMEIF